VDCDEWRAQYLLAAGAGWEVDCGGVRSARDTEKWTRGAQFFSESLRAILQGSSCQYRCLLALCENPMKPNRAQRYQTGPKNNFI
jgi:hypothetical protein